MSSERPTREELRQGMTVRIVQDDPNNDGEPIIGEVGTVLTEERTHPSGIKVKLQNGATGRVLDVVADPDAG